MHILCLSLKTQKALIVLNTLYCFHALKPLLTDWLELVHTTLTALFNSKLTICKLAPPTMKGPSPLGQALRLCITLGFNQLSVIV